jgi:hypothetical protein
MNVAESRRLIWFQHNPFPLARRQARQEARRARELPTLPYLILNPQYAPLVGSQFTPQQLHFQTKKTHNPLLRPPPFIHKVFELPTKILIGFFKTFMI